MVNKIWINKKVYVKILNSNRAYSGIVVAEDNNSITLLDIRNHQVYINKADVSLIQEEV